MSHFWTGVVALSGSNGKFDSASNRPRIAGIAN